MAQAPAAAQEEMIPEAVALVGVVLEVAVPAATGLEAAALAEITHK